MSGSIPTGVARASVWSGRLSCSSNAAQSDSPWPGRRRNPPAARPDNDPHAIMNRCSLGLQLGVHKSFPLLTSKLILAVNGSSKLSSKPSSLLKTCRSEWSELRTNSSSKDVLHARYLEITFYIFQTILKCQSILSVSHIVALKDLGALECLQANAG